ncbi:MAG: formylglycine-generating enzyme family protein [Beutenbergiaceae bacterium]
MSDAERDMVTIPAGTLLMGSADFYPDESPVHERPIASFAIDRYQVTNAQYAEFIDATGYRTVAEQPLEPADFPGANPADLVPGSMLFQPTCGPVNLNNWRLWWRWQPGACWRYPLGPGSSYTDWLHHPVVHVAYPDALAYCDWAGLRLPTEAEHEYAARGGGVGRKFAWGNEPYPDGQAQANTWLGRFPYDNHGVGGTAPVGSYPANGYGLFDMIGNAWEWTSDYYTPIHLPPGTALDVGSRPNLLAHTSAEPGSTIPRRVLKGGSFLCSPDYCLRFRPAARSPQSEDTGMAHVSFRCVRD